MLQLLKSVSNFDSDRHFGRILPHFFSNFHHRFDIIISVENSLSSSKENNVFTSVCDYPTDYSIIIKKNLMSTKIMFKNHFFIKVIFHFHKKVINLNSFPIQ